MRPFKLTRENVAALRSEAIDNSRIGIIILATDQGALTISNANSSAAHMLGTSPESLLGQPISSLFGPRTNHKLVEGLLGAMRDEKPWRGHNVLYAADLVPHPVEISATILHLKESQETFHVLTISPAETYFIAEQTRRLTHELGMLTQRTTPSPTIYDDAATLMTEDFADWCAIHLISSDGDLRLATLARRGEGVVEPAGFPEFGDQGIYSVAKSGIPLFDQPGIRSLSTLRSQMAETTGMPIHAVASVPIASSSLTTYGAITWAITDDQRLYSPDELMAEESAGLRLGHYLDQERSRWFMTRAIDVQESFLRAAGHELRTPVVSIKGYTQLLLRDLRKHRSNTDKMEAGLVAVENSVNKLTALLEDLFAATVQSDRVVPLRLTRTSIRAYLKDYIASTELYRHGEHILDGSGIVDDADVNIDLTRFTQVLDNVCSNAYQFSPSDEPVEISTHNCKNCIEILVRDHGRGLKRGSEDRIFEPYHLEEHGQELSSDHGSGLGLYISRLIVERHGGTMTASSDGPNTGTTIRIALPVHTD